MKTGVLSIVIGIMGLNTGASFATVVALVLLPSSSRGGLMLVSIAGATMGATAVYGLGSLSRGGLTPLRLALTGVAVSTLFGALGSGVTIYYDLGQDLLLQSARGCDAVQWSDVATFLPLAILGLVGACVMAPSLGVLALTNDAARGLGQRTKLTRFLASLIVLMLAGGAVAVAGPIGFVGLMVPHLVRYLVGLDYRLVIPGSALLGGLLVLFSLRMSYVMYYYVLTWMSGTLAGADWRSTVFLFPWPLVLFPWMLSRAKSLDVLSLGDGVAVGLGVAVNRDRVILTSAATILTSVCVAIGGHIGFLGLAAPHLARRLVGNRHAPLIPAAALSGAILLVVADGLSRHLLAPVEIPAGVLVGILGGIFFGANLLAGLSALYAARLTSRFGLINTMVFTHLPSNVLLILVPFMPNLPMAIAVLMLRFSISQMDVPIRQSYVMAVVPPEERSAAAGVTGVARTTGAAIAPMLAGVFLSHPSTFSLPFYLAGGLKIVYDLLLYRSFVTIRPPEEVVALTPRAAN